MHDAIVFQLAQLQGEHALGDVGQEAAQLIEALRAFAQMVENQNFPFTAYDVQSRGDSGTLLGVSNTRENAPSTASCRSQNDDRRNFVLDLGLFTD